MKRSELYYPTIAVPVGQWLRTALLYSDEISSIVPHDYSDRAVIPYSPEIQFLLSEGEFRAIRPDMLVQSWEKAKAFEQELELRIKTPSFQAHLQGGPRQLDSLVHRDKVSDAFFYQVLEPQQLAREAPGRSDWLNFERSTALLYMSCLAKYLSEIDPEATTPSTDLSEYQTLSLNVLPGEAGFACLDISLRNMLPVPRADAALSDILEFKRSRRQELLHFRTELDSVQTELATAETETQLKAVAVAARERVERGVSDLAQVLEEGRFGTIAATLKSLLSLKSPTLWGTAGVLAGKATKLADLPIEWSIGGLATLGAFEVGRSLIDARNKKRAALRDSPFAYAYHAGREGIA